MAICRLTLFLLTVKEISLVHFIITNFRVAHKMLCTPCLRNPLTISRLFASAAKRPWRQFFSQFVKVRFRILDTGCLMKNASTHNFSIYYPISMNKKIKYMVFQALQNSHKNFFLTLSSIANDSQLFFLNGHM
jgi:hypothetical protein